MEVVMLTMMVGGHDGEFILKKKKIFRDFHIWRRWHKYSDLPRALILSRVVMCPSSSHPPPTPQPVCLRRASYSPRPPSSTASARSRVLPCDWAAERASAGWAFPAATAPPSVAVAALAIPASSDEATDCCRRLPAEEGEWWCHLREASPVRAHVRLCPSPRVFLLSPSVFLSFIFFTVSPFQTQMKPTEGICFISVTGDLPAPVTDSGAIHREGERSGWHLLVQLWRWDCFSLSQLFLEHVFAVKALLLLPFPNTYMPLKSSDLE